MATNKRPKLQTLRPRLATLNTSRVATLQGTTPRLRGRKGMERRERWLSRNPLCVHCLEETPPRVTLATTPDHIIPLEAGGADDDSNLQSLCKRHHDIKTAREAAERGGKSRW